MTDTQTPDLTTLSISAIADMIEAGWDRVNFAARPYLDAMHTLQSIDEDYLADTGDSVVRYFLGNAQTWRGETARRVKAELNRRLN